MDKLKKQQLHDEYKSIFSDFMLCVLVEPKGLKVEETTMMRQALHKEESQYRVLKNRIAKIAAKDTYAESLIDNLITNRALIYTANDPVQTAKIAAKLLKDIENLNAVQAVLVENEKATVLSKEDLKELSELPSKEELISKLLFLMQSPVSQFATALNNIVGDFVKVLNLISENKK